MEQTLKRVQILIELGQDRRLREIAARQGKSVAEVTRQMIDFGLKVHEQEELFSRRQDALARAATLREQICRKHASVADIDVVADLEALREARDESITNRSG